MPIEIYTAEPQADSPLSNAINSEDHTRRREEVSRSNLHITPVSSHHVVVSATLLFETKGSPGSVQERPYPINLNFYLDDQQWRVDLLGLSHP